MNTFVKLLILGTGTGGILATGFINIRIPVEWMSYLDRLALAIWSIDGIIDVSFIFDVLYFLAIFELCVCLFFIYKWITQFIS